MGNLIKNDLIKAVKKKSILIFIIIFTLYIVLNSFIVLKYGQSSQSTFRTNDTYISNVKEQLKNLDPVTDSELYITYKSDVDLYELGKKYEEDSWQQFVAEAYLYQLIIEANTAEYGTAAQKAAIVGNPKAELEEKIAKLDNNDWQAFVKDDLNANKEQLTFLNAEYERLLAENDNIETAQVKEVKKNIKTVEKNIKLLQFRLDNSIPYGYGSLNNAIRTLEATDIDGINLDDENLSYSEKVAAQAQIAEYEEAKYTVENKIDTKNKIGLNDLMADVTGDYTFFIFVFIAIVVGAIVSSEFEKGTIKMNLIRPHKRAKILLSKYIVSLMMMVGIFAFTIIAQLLIGGLMLGFDSLSNPVIAYSFTAKTVISHSVLSAMFINLLYQLPMFIIFTTLAFTLSTISTNTPISVAMPILGFFVGLILNEIIIRYQIKALMFFPTLNWDLSQFMYGALPRYQHTNFTIAVVFNIMYVALMLIASFAVFNKKQIKNI